MQPIPMQSNPILPRANPTTNMPEVSSNKNILSSDVEIKGSIKFLNELIIDGKIEGEISSSGV